MENNESFLRTILRHAPKYFGASVLVSGVAMLMTRYYTSVFAPAEFGILSLYAMMLQYIITAVSLNMDSGATRIYFDYRKTARDEYLSTIFWFLAVTALVVLAGGVVLMPFLVPLISPHTENLYVVTLFAGIAAVFVSFLMRVLYNEQLSGSVFRHQMLQAIFNHLTSFILISVFRVGLFGRQIGQTTGYLINIFSLIGEFYKKNLFRLCRVFNKAMMKETLYLSLPGLITSLGTMSFVYLDRVFLKYYYGNAEVGIYSVGYIIGQGLSMIYEAVAMALFPRAMEDLKADYGKNIVRFEKFAFQYYAGLIVAAIVLSVNSQLAVALLSAKEYASAAGVLPFIVLGFMVGGFYKISSTLLSYHKIVWPYPFLAFFSFGINGYLNYLLVPKYGMAGAAFATFVGMFLYSASQQVLSMRFTAKRYNIITAMIYIGIFTGALIYFFAAVI